MDKLIMELHSIDGEESPMQFISTDLLAYYKSLEAEVARLKEQLQGYK